VASLLPADGTDPKRALETADALLYDAKRAGRNQGQHLDLVSGARHGVVGP
jgi:PleD family two-component response regulator